MTDIKSIETQMVYLGLIEKTAKSGNKYSIAKFVHDESQEVYEFFVSNDVVKEKAEKCLKYLPAAVVLELSSYQGSTRVDLRDVKQSK